MAKATGYSLWLMPSGDVYDKLTEIISRLSKMYSTPVFEPHITLIGGIEVSEEEIISKTSELASIIKPFEIRLDKMDMLDEYFKCLFVRIEPESIMKANMKARKIFNRENDKKYMSHLSLMYGNLSAETKEKIIAEIGNIFNIVFEVKSIYIFSTKGEPKDWHRIKEISLG